MATTRFKGETAGERLDLSGISDNDMIQLRHQPGTIEDTDKGISKSQLLSCPFGVSDTAASTGAKVASLTDSNPDFTLVSGREVVVCFTIANSASNPTLNFAGSGAIPIYYPNGQTVGAWPAETWMHLKYFYATVGNSTIQRWILLSDLPVDTVASGNMHSVTSNAVYDNLLSLFRINNFRVFSIGGDVSQYTLNIKNTVSETYTAVGFFIMSRYSTTVIHSEIGSDGGYTQVKSNVLLKKSGANVNVSSTPDIIKLSESSNWNNFTILAFSPRASIINGLTFFMSQ